MRIYFFNMFYRKKGLREDKYLYIVLFVFKFNNSFIK